MSMEEALQIELNGEPQKNLDLATLKKSKIAVVNHFNSLNKRSEPYRGIPLSSLMSLAIPNQLKEVVEIELVSVNGFKSYYSAEMLQKVDSILSYERTDGENFVRFSQKEKMLVPLGPYYFVWDFKNLAKDQREVYNSVYQVKKINFVTNKIDFGVNEGLDKEIFLGLRTYKKYCLSCHAIGKLGGDISFDFIKKKTLESKGAEFFI